jgi:hypothetical protein
MTLTGDNFFAMLLIRSVRAEVESAAGNIALAATIAEDVLASQAGGPFCWSNAI